MVVNLYQVEWNGVDLLNIAKQPNTLTKHGLPNQNFYEKYYSQLRNTDYALPLEWLKTKGNNSLWLKENLEKIAFLLKKNAKELNILSVGSGLGIVELPLIKEGYNITLHEIQSESLNFIKAQHPNLNIKIGLLDSKELFNTKFDVIYLGTVEYAITKQSDYSKFIQDIYYLLDESGIVLSYDPTPSKDKFTTKKFISKLLKKIGIKKKHPSDAVFWGVLRSIPEKIKCWKKFGFEIVEYGVFDKYFTRQICSSSNSADFKKMNSNLYLRDSISYIMVKRGTV